jgi:MYXO-CTERM domain-containing protein
MQKDASSQVSLDTATAVFDGAFSRWASAGCGHGKPGLAVHDLGPVACDRHEYNTDGPNANIIIFRDDSWPYPAGVDGTIALTTVTYDLNTGEIYDADIELNSAERRFTTTDTGIQYDLASIAQHETGHFLGLSHSQVGSATMYYSYVEGDKSLRSLDPDDVNAICAAYPPPGPANLASCDPTPRHGFSSECAADSQGGGCSTTPAHAGLAGTVVAPLGLVAAAFARRRRRRVTR